ncbi:unnamed protein product [Lathyrus sativus]|nr:unnamed protein product [Lathyrus sativus]
MGAEAEIEDKKWRYTWESQSHTPILRLFLFPFSKTLNLSLQHHNLTVHLHSPPTFLTLTSSSSSLSLRVPIPTVLLDAELPPTVRSFTDHIEVKLLLLLPVDHPALFALHQTSPLPQPLLIEYDVDKLSSAGEVEFVCRSCRYHLTNKPIRNFVEMPSANWREVADNWFGACCCSFGGISEKLVTRSSNLSKNIDWHEFTCPQCATLLGAYPCCEGCAPVDGGVRLFKCYISTCLPVLGSGDIFSNYTMDKMFANRLAECANDESTFRFVVRDLKTKSPVLQIILLNLDTWSCSGYCFGAEDKDPDPKLQLRPVIKVLFSDSEAATESQLRVIEEWAAKNSAEDIFMLTNQIQDVVNSLMSAKDIYPPSCASLPGLTLSYMQR